MIKKKFISCFTALSICASISTLSSVSAFGYTKSTPEENKITYANLVADTADADDVTTPSSLTLVSSNVNDGDSNVAVDTSVILKFSEPLDKDTVDGDSVYMTNDGGQRINIKYTLSMDCKTLTLKPYSDLVENCQYGVNLTSNLQDKDGDSLPDDQSWTFTTGKAPLPSKDIIPSKPTNFKGVVVSPFSIKWTWDSSDNADGYVVKDENGNIVGTVDRNTSTQFVETGLSQGKRYKRTVEAYKVNDLGEKIYSDDSNSSSYTTKVYKIAAPVVYTKIDEITSEKIIWRFFYRSVESSYKLNVYDENGTAIATHEPIDDKTFVENVDLSKNSKVVVRKFSFIDTATNAESPLVTVSITNPYYTDGGTSLQAPKIKAGAFNNDSVEISIKDKSRDETGFKIYEVDDSGKIINKPGADIASPEFQIIDAKDTSGINDTVTTTLYNLDSSKVYHFIVKAYSDTLGEGDASNMITVNEAK